LSEIKLPFDVYQGGRFISAVSRNKNLAPFEKLILLTIGNELDFRNIQDSQRYISNAKLAEYTSMSERSVMRLTKKLSADGYLVKTDRFDDKNRQQSNLYSLSPKVFMEYAGFTEGDCVSPMRVTACQSNLPQKEIPNKSSLSYDKDVCACAHAPNRHCPDQIVEVPIEEEIKPKALKRKARPRKLDRPRVTPSHQKIARIFAPDSRFVKNTYWDKGSLFFRVDEFLEKQGESGHQVIDMLYRHCKDRDICGRKPFDLATVDLLLREAVNEFTRTLGVDDEQT
jgi:hypothetical protein